MNFRFTSMEGSNPAACPLKNTLNANRAILKGRDTVFKDKLAHTCQYVNSINQGTLKHPIMIFMNEDIFVCLLVCLLM